MLNSLHHTEQNPMKNAQIWSILKHTQNQIKQESPTAPPFLVLSRGAPPSCPGYPPALSRGTSPAPWTGLRTGQGVGTSWTGLETVPMTGLRGTPPPPVDRQMPVKTQPPVVLRTRAAIKIQLYFGRL